MSDAPPVDPELAEIRARRIRELLDPKPEPSGPPVALGPVDLDARSFSAFLSDHAQVVVDVWAPWCGPCRAMAPILDSLVRELAPRVSFAKLDADKEPALATRWNVSGIPTLLLFARARLIDRVVEARSQAVLRARLGSAFGLTS